MTETNYELIINRESLASALQVPLSQLTGVLYGRGIDSYYYSFDVPKKDGTYRRIDASTQSLKFIQRRLVRLLESRLREVLEKKGIAPNISHAFQHGKSIMTNARIHKNKRYVIKLDLEDFFGSIHFGRVRGFFEHNKDFKTPHDIATIIAQLVCYKGRLPQGAPSSPIVTNLICNIMDMRLLRLAKKYKLDYTRYADDLTFSTNSKSFTDRYEAFLSEVKTEIKKAGYNVNEKKTVIQYKTSRQEVTGLVVNEKIAINSQYRKETRAMLDHLYKTGNFLINGEQGSISQLEGRLSFIDQIDYYNRKNGSRNESEGRNSRELQYQQFMFYKFFINSERPVIITEGPTDILHIRAALKNLYSKYPDLIEKTNDGGFCYKVSFFKMSKKNAWLINRSDGGDKFRILNSYYGINSKAEAGALDGIIEKFVGYNIKPRNPVAMIIDNEDDKNKPLHKMLNSTKMNDNLRATIKTQLNEKGFYRFKENLYIATMPKKEQGNIEIEDLYGEEQLTQIDINGKKYCNNLEKAKEYDSAMHFTKMELANYISTHWKKIDFTGFEGLLSGIEEIVIDYGNCVKGADRE